MEHLFLDSNCFIFNDAFIDHISLSCWNVSLSVKRLKGRTRFVESGLSTLSVGILIYQYFVQKRTGLSRDYSTYKQALILAPSCFHVALHWFKKIFPKMTFFKWITRHFKAAILYASIQWIKHIQLGWGLESKLVILYIYHNKIN